MRICVAMVCFAGLLLVSLGSVSARDQGGGASCGQRPQCSGSRDCENRKQAYQACMANKRGQSSAEK